MATKKTTAKTTEVKKPTKKVVKKETVKKIKCIETGIEYDNIDEIVKETHLRRSQIDINLRKPKYSVKGFHFEYVN